MKLPETMTGQESLNVIADYLMGEHWYVADTGSAAQVNPLVVDAILKEYSPKYRKEMRKPLKERIKIKLIQLIERW